MIGQELTAKLQECVTHCLECHRLCLRAAMKYHLNAGANPLDVEQIRLLINCAEICHTTATAILVGAPLVKATCRVCARVCRRCEADAARHGWMYECAQASRRCADSCQRAAGVS